MNDTTPMDAMQIESRLEKHCDRSSATEEFASVTRHLPTIDGIEIDSVQHGVYRIWIGSVLIGIVRRDGVFGPRATEIASLRVGSAFIPSITHGIKSFKIISASPQTA